MTAPGMVDKTAATVEHFTPPHVLEMTRRYARALGREGIDLDPATSPDNWTRAGTIFTETDDGLARSWRLFDRPTFVWLNSPWGRALRAWVEKAAREADGGATIVALLPGQRFEQRYFQQLLLTPARTRAVVAITGRLDFYGRVCARCGELEVHKVHREGRCVFAWSGDRRQGHANPYGSFLYLLGPGHDERAARAVFRGLGWVFGIGWVEPYTAPAGTRRGIARQAYNGRGT